MDTYNKILEIILFMPGFLLSLSCHEAAHGYMASLLGDNTAKSQGRVSLNPVVHSDLLGTIILPILGLYLGGFVFGWGKPVPIDYRNFKNPKRDVMLTALAGPAANFIMAIVISMVVHVFVEMLPSLRGGLISDYGLSGLHQALVGTVFMNLGLCFFNLIPVEPLDGGKILVGLLPNKLGYQWEMFTARYGWMILLFLFFTRTISKILAPIIFFFAALFGIL
jgi:Zn-dependent protease